MRLDISAFNPIHLVTITIIIITIIIIIMIKHSLWGL